MSKDSHLKPFALALGAAFVGSLTGAGLAQAADNPFGQTQLRSGYMVADSHEATCGANKAAEEAKAKAAGEAKCGGKKEDMPAREEMSGAGHEGKPAGEGKCGEAKCGGKK